ncbi:MAG: redoxin domain-containing protein [Ferruginibacter sp.]|nr:redoxin domain-containing protein [Cytophagales bacterium]
MRQLKPGQTAPEFCATNVAGKTVRLSDYRGKTVLLTFQRNVGCPVCNLRFHALEQHRTDLRAKGIEVLAVYESAAVTTKQYLGGQTPYAQLIPDPEQKLYALYGAERSFGKLLSGVLLHGGLGKMSASKKLNPHLPKQDGHPDRIGADFLIDPAGRIIRAHYHRFVGDDLPLSEVVADGLPNQAATAR